MTRAARAIRTRSTKECADVLRAMGEGTRLRILQSLLCREQCVNEIAQALDLPQPHVSHHLQILRNVGLVEGQREGQRICYRLLPAIESSVTDHEHPAIDLGCCCVVFR